jgi:hypothetical protein
MESLAGTIFQQKRPELQHFEESPDSRYNCVDDHYILMPSVNLRLYHITASHALYVYDTRIEGLSKHRDSAVSLNKVPMNGWMKIKAVRKSSDYLQRDLHDSLTPSSISAGGTHPSTRTCS